MLRRGTGGWEGDSAGAFGVLRVLRVLAFGTNLEPQASPSFLMPKLFLLSAAIALVAQLAVLRSVIAGRAPASSPGRGARIAEIAWVALPTLALIAILLFTWGRVGEPVAIAPVNGVIA